MLFMYQAAYTAKSMAAQITDPHDPLDVIRPTLEELGAKLVVAGFPFGEYDLLVVYEAPDDVTAASVAMAVAAAGEVKSAKTTRLLSGQEWLESLRKRRIVTTREARQPYDDQRQSPELLQGGGRAAGVDVAQHVAPERRQRPRVAGVEGGTPLPVSVTQNRLVSAGLWGLRERSVQVSG